MRTFFKEPTYELLPVDDMNAVPFIYKVDTKFYFRLAAEYLQLTATHCYFLMTKSYPISLDPTRRLENVTTFHVFDRSEVEMYHMSFVRKDIRSKMTNVSNKGNYGSVDAFLREFDKWTPAKGAIHPHPYIFFFRIALLPFSSLHFDTVKILENYSTLLELWRIFSTYIWKAYAIAAIKQKLHSKNARNV